MKLEHTQGEWKIESLAKDIAGYLQWLLDAQMNTNGTCDNILWIKGDHKIVSIIGNGIKSKPNAKLIAAAPEMLEALIELLLDRCDLCIRINPHHKKCTSCNDVIPYRNIIEKATGKTWQELNK